MAAVLAHAGQFTWDEALFVLAPVLLLALVLVLATRRARHLRAEREAAGDVQPDTTSRPPAGADG